MTMSRRQLFGKLVNIGRLEAEGISVEKAVPLHLEYPKNSFLDNTLRHFGGAFDAISKGDGNFLDFESKQPSGELHFDLESISNEIDF